VSDVHLNVSQSAFCDRSGKLYSWSEDDEKPALAEKVIGTKAEKICMGLDFAIGLGQVVKANPSHKLD
jgi:hypothetical protein